MNTNEVFELISVTEEFKKRDDARLLKHRHKKGTLTNETYVKLFDYFGYKELPDKWVEK